LAPVEVWYAVLDSNALFALLLRPVNFVVGCGLKLGA